MHSFRYCIFTPIVDNRLYYIFFEMFLLHLKEKSIWQVYLLTNHPQSVTIFQFFNFITVEKHKVPEGIEQFERFCENINGNYSDKSIKLSAIHKVIH